jgi:hypothetical protein
MGVRCTRTRAEYEQHFGRLSSLHPPPMAFYSAGAEELYMYAEPVAAGRAEETLFHEAGHQLLHLAANFMAEPGEPYYWVTEALPCTFEGLVERDGKLVAEVNRLRFANVRARLAAGRPLPRPSTLDAMTQAQYQADEYDQGCTLAWFLLTANGGRHRKGFLRFVADVELTRVRPETFQKQVGRAIDEFETEWRAFVVSVPLGGPEK